MFSFTKRAMGAVLLAVPVVAALGAAVIGLPACAGSSVTGSSSAPSPPVPSTKGTESTPQAVSSSPPSDKGAESTPQAVSSSRPYDLSRLPSRSPVPPIEFAVGDKQVVLRFRNGVGDRFRFVESIAMGSEIVYPPHCDTPTPPASGLCSPSHLELRSALGKGKDLQLVGTHVRGQQLDLLFAAVFEGSPECGVYGYWLIRIGSTGARATSPIVGCMTDPFPEGPYQEYRNPTVRWGPPVSIRVHVFDKDWRRFELNSQTFKWTQVAGSIPTKDF